MNRAHIFLLTSISVDGDAEGQGLVLQEAQACGLPVIATRHGAFPEGIAPDNQSWMVPERDVQALTAKLADLCDAHSARLVVDDGHFAEVIAGLEARERFAFAVWHER